MMSLSPRSVDFDQLWLGIKDCVGKVLTRQKIDPNDWNNYFHDIYLLCVSVPDSYADRLYEEVEKCLTEHVEGLHGEFLTFNDDELLDKYYECWSVYHEAAKYVHTLFKHLNEQHIKKQKYTEADLLFSGMIMDHLREYKLEVGEMALNIWRSIMIQALGDDLVRLILKEIDNDRHGIPVRQTIVQGVVLSFVDVEGYKSKYSLSVYEERFETRFLETTTEYYEREASTLFSTCTSSQYMEKVLKKIEEENLRAVRFLNHTSAQKVMRICQQTMVAEHIEFLNSVTSEIVKREDKKDLSNLYALLKPIQKGLTLLTRQFEDHIKSIGLQSMRNVTERNLPQYFVETTLEIIQKFSDFVRDLFNNDQEFWNALDRACLAIINYREPGRGIPKASEWLARHVDQLLRKTTKGLTDSEIEDKLTFAIVIFRYIEDKDVFQKFYSRMLAQRLIHSLSASMYAEESMIGKLKQVCGYEFTCKFQRMFTDVGVSRELTSRFLNGLEANGQTLDVGFQVLILQAGAWPLFSTPANAWYAVPQQLQPSINLFNDFYRNSFNGRKITWLYNMSSADVKLTYLSRTYTVTVTLFQLSALLCFNDTDTATLDELRAATQITDESLERHLNSIVDVKLLLCSTDEICSDSVFQLNTEFSSKRTKFRIVVAPLIPKQAEETENEHIGNTVQLDRRYFLECAIVRIMKSKKRLRHSLLVQEVVQQARPRFVAETPLIKKVIEQLIDKQYLSRTENPDEYAYLA